MSDFKNESEENDMVYVTWADANDEEVNVVSFSTMEEAEEFVEENNISDIADINAMDWQIERWNNDLIGVIDMYTGKLRIPTNRFCFRCGSRVYHSDVKGYPYVCHECDENMYTFETYKKKDKDTYVNPIAYAIQNRKQM